MQQHSDPELVQSLYLFNVSCIYNYYSCYTCLVTQSVLYAEEKRAGWNIGFEYQFQTKLFKNQLYMLLSTNWWLQ